MKAVKIFTLAAAGAMLFGAVSCSSEENVSVTPVGDGNVTLRASLPADMMTRAFGDGLQAKKLSYAVYNAGETTPIAGMTVDGDDAIDMAGLTATVQLKLVTGRSYDIIFWAESAATATAAQKPYSVTWDGQTLDVDYDAVASNDESRDAFFVKHTLTVTGPMNEDVVLRRPFAQVNFGSDDLAEKSVIDAYGEDLQTSVTTTAYTQLNLGNGAVDGQKEVTFDYAGLPENETFPVQPEKYGYVSMNYLLVPADRSIVDLKFDIRNATQVINTITVSAAPVQRNYRTNIYGSLLTSTADFNVRIDPIFEEPGYDMPVLENNTYKVSTPAEMAWIAATVNSGDRMTGKTISIEADMDFTGVEWTPIGTPANVLNADIEGNGHTISNLKVEGAQSVGFVGYTWRKVSNLTFENVEVRGNNWVGVVVGHTQDGCPNFGIDNVTVKNATVITTPRLVNGAYDDGDKAGVIMGYYPAAGGNSAITNCTVDGATVTGYRDIAGIVGYGNYTVTGNTVKNVQIIQDLTNGYKTKAEVENRWGEVNGNRNSDKTTGNTVENVTYKLIGE